VVFVDTAGLDDSGPVGELRAKRSLDVLARTDLALLVTDQGRFGEFENAVARLLGGKAIPFVVAVNKIDQEPLSPGLAADLAARGLDAVGVSAATGQGLEGLRALLVEKAPESCFEEPRLLGDLLRPGGLAVLVVPIDLGAPRGRLILPQVQAIRDALDSDAACLVVKERELAAALDNLPRRPDLVVCDSQVVLKAVADTPPEIPLTTFSILMARLKGDLCALASAAAALNGLRPGDRVLIAEACTHHPLADDIGRVKIPRWLNQYAGGGITAEVRAGRDFPEDLSSYAAAIHCGGCVITRRHMLSRLHGAFAAGVPLTNYGLAISLLQGVLDRVLEPFPAALEAFRSAKTKEVPRIG